MRYSKENLEFVNKRKNELNKKNIEIREEFKKIAKIINNKSFIFNRESKENGELYGTIKPKEITSIINEKIKIDVKPSQVILKEEINKIGTFKINLRFHSEVSASITIKVDKIKAS